MEHTISPKPCRTGPPRSSTQRKVENGFGFALACLGIIGVVSYLAVARLQDAAARVEHSRAVIDQVETIFSRSTDAQNGYRGYAATGVEDYLQPYHQAVESTPRDLGTLELLLTEADQQRRFAELVAFLNDQLNHGAEIIAMRRAQGVETGNEMVLTLQGKKMHDRIRTLTEEMKQGENMRLVEHAAQAERSAAVAKSVIVGGSVIAFGFVGIALLAIRRDFVGRWKAEQALLQSEENLAVTLHSIGDAVLATDTFGKITQMNREAERLTGWTFAQGAGRRIEDVLRLVNEGTRRTEEIPLNRVVETGEAQGLADQTVLIARDGTECAIADSAAPILDREGRVTGVVVVFRDVSLQRAAAGKLAAAQAELARERARLKFIFDSVPVGISFVVIDPNGERSRLINDAHLRICGMTRQEADEPDAFLRITHPDDRERQAALARQLDAGLINHFSIDKRYVMDDGRIVWVMLLFQRQRMADGSVEELSIVVDITELKKAVAQLERFFELSIDFLCISSVDGYFKRVSPAVVDILGWEIDEFLRQPYLTFVHPDDQEATIRTVQRQILSGEKVLQFENRYRHKDGSWRVLSWRSVPETDGLMYATARDVTERNRAHEEIQRLNTALQIRAAQLETANKELEAFSYSVSHDLRAPLRHIQGFVVMLTREADEKLSEKARRHLQIIADAGRDMGRLIDDLLSFSRMGRAEMHETTIEPAELIENVRGDLVHLTAERNIQWKIGVLPKAKGDPSMFRQVFANLLGNAIKYTRGRDPAIIEIGYAGDENGQMILYVRDNGAGFDMKYVDKLYGVFQRLHHSNEFEGTGIGLANVRRIVVRHGGRTWAEGAPNAGATFYLTLPKAPTGDST